MRLNAVKQPRNFRAALVSNQRHLMPTRNQFRRKRVRRHHVSTGTTSGKNEMTRNAHRPLHFTT